MSSWKHILTALVASLSLVACDGSDEEGTGPDAGADVGNDPGDPGDPGDPAGGGDGGIPAQVSFALDVSPMFELRGCVTCHEGGGIGKDLGGLHLNGADEKMYRELTQEISQNYGVPRVNVADPAASLMLTLPSPETPLEQHPATSFTGPDDPGYQLVLRWIQQGAQRN